MVSADSRRRFSKNNRNRVSRNRRDKCFSCGERGHWAVNCPNVPDAADKCFACGETGHYAAHCPNKDSVFWTNGTLILQIQSTSLALHRSRPTKVIGSIMIH